jgi:membrane protease YdiL (CAAX protease family)
MLKTLFKTDLRFDWKIVTITIVSTLVMMLDYYHQFFPGFKGIDRTILYFVVPMVFIIFVFRENPKDYGFQLGDWKAGLVITIGSLAILLPVLWLLVHGDANMQKYYDTPLNMPLPLYTFLEIFGWEFIFRGWLTFGYARKFGADALWIQAVPFALMHISKPEVETLSTIFGGFVFGWVAYRTKSFLYPFLIHWGIFSFVVLTARGAFG